jgi:catechol 2,3-dioxygenase-like lactoylglutathione lyase family enzyme
VLPVSDVDRAKQFYTVLGWREDIDLVVSDVAAARAELVERGAAVSEVFHGDRARFHLADTSRRAPGLDPERRSYQSYASFSDPDGNDWVLQEVQQRLPGR